MLNQGLSCLRILITRDVINRSIISLTLELKAGPGHSLAYEALFTKEIILKFDFWIL